MFFLQVIPTDQRTTVISECIRMRILCFSYDRKGAKLTPCEKSENLSSQDREFDI
jgi:hypothetical protein